MDYNSRQASRIRMRLALPEGAMTAAAATAEASEVFQKCGCKGIRTCLICERQLQVDPPWQLSPQVRTVLPVEKLKPSLALYLAGI